MEFSADNHLVLILSGAALLVIGLIVGLLIGKRTSPAATKQRDMEEQLDTLLQEHKSYQSDVTEHFSQTASLLNNLTTAYRDVHQHLALGAGNLCDTEAPLPLTQIDSATDAQEIPPELSTVQQPLDYAPKSSPDETGMLNEKFGLDKSTVPDSSPQKP